MNNQDKDDFSETVFINRSNNRDKRYIVAKFEDSSNFSEIGFDNNFPPCAYIKLYAANRKLLYETTLYYKNENKK